MAEKPTPESIKRAYEEGKAAAAARRTFREHCPYTYDRFMRGGMSAEEFHVTKRPLMNAWFDGWKGKVRVS